MATLSDDSKHDEESHNPVMIFISMNIEEDEEGMVDFEGSFENDYRDLDIEESEETTKPELTHLSVGATCETNSYFSPTTTNWYEMTVLNELESCSTNLSDAGKDTQPKTISWSSAEDLMKIVEGLDEDCKI